MACGRPVIHSQVPGLASLSEDGRTAVQVSRHEDPTAWAEAISGLKKDAEAARRLGTCAAAHAEEHFSIERTVEQLASLYEAKAP
jgi:glycosyltransferase involved in cell wall biosynthesis